MHSGIIFQLQFITLRRHCPKKIPDCGENFSLACANKFSGKKSVGIGDVRQKSFNFDELKIFVRGQESFDDVLIFAANNCASAVK